ncbi:MAG TPA: 6-phospho-beta-glucosidase [Segeticoccus sp.]|uniref:6-phospho-beta-glucosidase n=1 Tax=Segeticoccus sp. TaxID=2706531 RepID=UPI002D80906D|nr:6-phospho-beta-glucosidase [Segeticoccus sp.]HET8599148.1 6-phospho-beta-glucosidase [Segeticoccus sp.]
MRLTILGGGGFRVPLVYGALVRDAVAGHEPRVTEVVLYDEDATRLRAVASVLEQMAPEASRPAVRSTTDLDEALTGADFVFSAIRVGGLHGRTCDERVALDLGVLGQETTGPGGIAYALRTIPVARAIAERVRACCPQAWVINFTNPAGMVTEAMQELLGARVTGICDSPIALARRAARALGLDPARTEPDYVGLNHLGWLRGLRHAGRDVLPDLLADDAALGHVEEARLFGPAWVRLLGVLPNEYLYYYYFARESVAAILAGGDTRGEFLLRQQEGFYASAAADPGAAYREWQQVRRERDATYMQESRQERAAGERDEEDLQGGGYEGVALALMAAIARGERSTMILNVCNGSAVPGLPPEAVVEVPCAVSASGPQPLATRPLAGDQLGLLQQVKAVEQLTIRAAVTGSRSLALKAFALHPLVDSFTTAQALLDGYAQRIPEVAAALPNG